MTRLVQSIYDDSPVPLVGLVVGWEDEDRCLVLWGDARFAPDNNDPARVEYADELTPRQTP
jgi:hypothetical protein